MAREYRQFGVAIATGTISTAPQATKLTMPPRIVSAIRVRVPPGPRGVMGFAIANAGTAVVPIVSGSWIVTDDSTELFPLTQFTTSGTWWLLGYNTGEYPHTVYLTFACTLPAVRRSTLTPATSVALSTTPAPTAATTPAPTAPTPATGPTVPTPGVPGVTLTPVAVPPGIATPPPVVAPPTLPAPPAAPKY